MLTWLLAASLAVPRLAGDPPVHVWLNNDAQFSRGDRARVYVETRDDGYLLVLRADVDGRVRVLFPLDPGDDQFVRAGKQELRDRADREAFFVDQSEGTGVVLAAFSHDPFKVDGFVRVEHWDDRVLGEERLGSDPEGGLVDLVQRMIGTGHFDYDVARYTVGQPNRYYNNYASNYFYDPYAYSCFGCYGYGPRFGLGFSFGYGYAAYCDPWFYDPFCFDRFLDPFFSPFGYTSIVYYPNSYYYPRGYSPRGYIYGRPYTFKPATPVNGTGVRRRTFVASDPVPTSSYTGGRRVVGNDNSGTGVSGSPDGGRRASGSTDSGRRSSGSNDSGRRARGSNEGGRSSAGSSGGSGRRSAPSGGGA